MEDFNKSARLAKSLEAMVAPNPHELTKAFAKVSGCPASVKEYVLKRKQSLQC